MADLEDESTTSDTSLTAALQVRVEEYKAVYNDVAQYSARRQTTNTLFVGINTIFLSGIGIVLGLSRLSSWWDLIAIGGIAIVVLPLNLVWRATLKRYRGNSLLNFAYLREIEQDLHKHIAPALGSPAPRMGIFLRYDEDKNRLRVTDLEVGLATYFVVLYPAIVLMAAACILLVQTGIIPPFSLT